MTSSLPQGGPLFAKPPPAQSSTSILGGLGTTLQQSQLNLGLFGGKPSQPQATGSIFGGQSQQNSSPFGGLGSSNQETQQGSSAFGKLSQQQPTSSLFGQQPQPTNSLFGQQPQPTTSLFGQQPQPNSSSFGVLGSGNQQSQQQSQQKGGFLSGLNASSLQQQQQPQQQPQGGSIFLGQSSQPQQQQQQSQPQSTFHQSSRLWSDTEASLRPRSVPDQMELALAKWNPESPMSLFRTYLYNTVDPDRVPFYRPGPQDDEAKWEEALRKKPTPGSVPVIVRGFYQLGQRLLLQEQHLSILQGRLHEINNGLTTLLRKHDLEISIRAAECKRKHLRLSHQCLKLAAKVQVLKNRGYSMDSTEEELREKLLKLERSVSDPALGGRAEEIWARMVSVREKARMLQRELERAGPGGEEVGVAMDEEVMKRAKKILEDFGSQLAHLNRELHQIQKDFTEWEGNSKT